MKNQKNNIVWIDLDNSPHVLFFRPIIKELEKRGMKVMITARDYAQVFELLDLFQISYINVGKHPGKSKVKKLVVTFFRGLKLARVIKQFNPTLSLSLGSRSQLIASKILQIKSAITFDYEFTRMLPFIHPEYAFIPEAIEEKNLLKFNSVKISKFKGIKEDIYVPSFEPDPNTRNKLVNLGVDFNKIIVLIRPPATLAHYHTKKSQELFDQVMIFLEKIDGIIILVTPRTKEQRDEICALKATEISKGKIIIVDIVINGLDLLSEADIVISGGGTMIREAAALGIPSYSTFGGKIGGVDHYLEKSGRIVLLQSENDFKDKLLLQKRDKTKATKPPNNLILEEYIDNIFKIV